MLVTKAAIQALMVGYSGVYRSAYDDAPTYSDQFTTILPSSTASNTYGWMTRIPGLRKWVGSRVFKNMKTQAYTLVNETYESSVEMMVNDIEDDNLGVYGPMFSELGRGSSMWQDQVMKGVLQSNPEGFDGQPLFSAAHDLGDEAPADQSNVETSFDLTAQNYNTVRSKMQSYVGNDGEPLGVMPDLIVVPPQLEVAAKEIVNALTTEKNGAAVPNQLNGTARVLVVPQLANEPKTWYVFDTSRGINAVVFQLRQAPQLTQKTALTDDCVFEDDMFRVGVKARGVGGVGLWWLGHKCVGS
jgi:phage major head subunit gpT-like protein